jgi:hypothetical protein
MKKNLSFLVLIYLLALIILTSCKTENHRSDAHSVSKIYLVNNQKMNPPSSFFSTHQLPISISEGEFNSVIGWLSDDEIVYMTNIDGGSNLYRYNLIKGNSELLYKSKNPIVTSLISPDQERVLIHSAPSTYEGQVTIITNGGEERFNKEFPSVEMGFEWNQYNTNQLIITAFKEDWSFTNYFLEINKKEMNAIEIRKPFSKWTGENKIAFLDWNENDISLLSPLIQKEFSKPETLLKEDIFQFDTFINNILTITVDSSVQKAKYTFYNENMEELSVLNAPVLSSYSGWIVPSYEISSDEKEFLTMIPMESAEADTYRGGFQFISFNIKSGEKMVIMENTENVPFTCSPNKMHCLMGYQYEKLFSLENKKMVQLF